MDENYDGAWSAALNRFDNSLSVAIERGDYKLAEIEGAYYKTTILDLISRFKRHKKLAEDDLFLAGIRERQKLAKVNDANKR